MRERGFKAIHLVEEMIAEFEYRPTKCKKDYRVIVLRKKLGIDEGQMRLFEEYRYFFYITNDRTRSAEEIVFLANDRCDQENLIAQLKGCDAPDNAGERPGEQLGVHGDGEPGLEFEGVGRVDGTGGTGGE